ncbi:hypothetical protein [Trueperella sp. LYQ143]|uniref:hypothetical protein n=1 Tax=Trueperella sp. LYQ143 TaxID=3391059 RepID=UPI003982EDB5
MASDEFDIICVECDGKTAAWTRHRGNGNVSFTGDREIAEPAKYAALCGDLVPVFGYAIEASESDPIGALAALFASNPGRTQFTSTNMVEVMGFLDEIADDEPYESPYVLVDPEDM